MSLLCGAFHLPLPRPPGCPVEMDVRNPAQGKSITASGLGLHQSRANKPTSFVLETLGHAGKEFDVVVTSPTGAAVPVKCYQQKDGNMLVEFVPGVAGEWQSLSAK